MVKFSEHFKPKCAIMSLPIYKLHHLCPSLYLCWALSPADWFLPFLAPENQTNSCSLPGNDTHNDVTTDNAQHRSVPIDTFLDTDFAKRAKKLTEVDTNSEKMHKYFLSHSFEDIFAFAAVWPHTVGRDASVVLICWLSMCAQWGQGYDGLVPVSPVYGCGYWGHNSNDLSLIWPLSGDLG